MLASITAAAHAIAVDRAAGFLPPSWSWAHDRRIAWLLVGATTLMTIGTAWGLAKAKAADARRADRLALTVETEYAFPTTLGLHRPPTSKCRWTLMFRLSYAGARVLTVLDLIPCPPSRRTYDDQEVSFVRTTVSS